MKVGVVGEIEGLGRKKKTRPLFLPVSQWLVLIGAQERGKRLEGFKEHYTCRPSSHCCFSSCLPYVLELNGIEKELVGSPSAK